MFTLKNPNAFIRGIEKFEKSMDKDIEETYRGWTVAIFKRIVITTPQWSGNAASNWNYSIGKVDNSYETELLEQQEKLALFDTENNQGKLKKKGDAAAVQSAFIKNEGRDSAILVNGSGNLPFVFISNPSRSLKGKAYAEYLENNKSGFLRAENDPGHMVKNTSYRFGSQGKIDKPLAKIYRKIRI